MSTAYGPEIVFTEEYWGLAEERQAPVPPLANSLIVDYLARLASGRATKATREHYKQTYQYVMSEGFEGTSVATETVYNPASPENAQNSPCNYPGSVLLIDREQKLFADDFVKEVYDVASKSGVALNGLPRFNTNADDVLLSARDLLRRQVYPNGEMAKGSSFVTVLQGDEMYSRNVMLVINLAKRNGTARPNRCDNIPLTGKGLPFLYPANADVYPAQVGVTTTSGPECRMLQRVRSIEICATGVPASVKAKRLWRFSGQIARSPGFQQS